MEDIHSNRGKWSQPGVPHRGWRFVSDYDSCENGEELHVTCQMCESQLIRYVHVLSHDDYPELLECGCVCAGRMEEDHVSAKAREVAMRKRATRKNRQKQSAAKRLREGWVLDETGKWRVRSQVGKATVFPNSGLYNVRMHLSGEGPWFDSERYATADAAKTAVEGYLLDRLHDVMGWSKR